MQRYRSAGGEMKRALVFACLASAFSLSHAAVIDTNNAATVAAFQAGLNVVNFDSFTGPTGPVPKDISSYASGAAVSDSAKIFNEIPGVQFSVGGAVGSDRPALYRLTDGNSADAHSPSTVLGPVDF